MPNLLINRLSWAAKIIQYFQSSLAFKPRTKIFGVIQADNLESKQKGI